jgi:hypothetical protein
MVKQMHPVVTKEFTRRLEQAEINALTSRLTAVMEQEGNPVGVEIRHFGHATAFTARNIPGPSFNTVKGLRHEDLDIIDDMIAYYEDIQIPCRIEITPGHSSPELLASLTHRGFAQTDFHTVLYGVPYQEEKGQKPTIQIRRLASDEFDVFAHIYVRGFRMPDVVKEGVKRNNAVLYDRDGWHFYVASVHNEPAAVGVLHIEDQIATLAAAATLPKFRTRGCHQSLIRLRIRQAFFSRCEWVTGQASFGSKSQNNMERSGMNIAYTKAIWEKADTE